MLGGEGDNNNNNKVPGVDSTPPSKSSRFPLALELVEVDIVLMFTVLVPSLRDESVSLSKSKRSHTWNPGFISVLWSTKGSYKSVSYNSIWNTWFAGSRDKTDTPASCLGWLGSLVDSLISSPLAEPGKFLSTTGILSNTAALSRWRTNNMHYILLYSYNRSYSIECYTILADIQCMQLSMNLNVDHTV